MTPESFANNLNATLADGLITVALFGPATQVESKKRHRSVQILVVCEQLGMEELDALSPAVTKWVAQGNPLPLLFTRERLLNSAHVFPIKLLDIKENHRILHGLDLLKSLPISQENLQFQLEHELKLRLIQLREGYLLAGRSDSEVLDLMLRTNREYLALLAAILRFFEISVPVNRTEAVTALAKHVEFKLTVFTDVEAIQSGGGALPATGKATRELFARYLAAAEQCSDLVSRLGRRS